MQRSLNEPNSRGDQPFISEERAPTVFIPEIDNLIWVAVGREVGLYRQKNFTETRVLLQSLGDSVGWHDRL